MKRSRHLHPLSWEHHAGLVVALRIERGLGYGVDPAVITDYALTAWSDWLRPHFDLEEELLPPLLEGALGDMTVLRQLFREHEEFEEPVAQLRAGETPEKSLRAFAWALREHIRFEEREMMPMLECTLDEQKLAELGKTLHERHEHPSTGWPVKFWEKPVEGAGD